MSELCYIKVINGRQFLFMPDGTKVPGVQKTVVIDDCAYTPKARVRLIIASQDSHTYNFAPCYINNGKLFLPDGTPFGNIDIAAAMPKNDTHTCTITIDVELKD